MGAQSQSVAVGMSGGVDSSVAAAILKAEGHQVIGVTALMTHGPSRCCSDEDVLTAQRVAEQLGIRHHTVDVHSEFQREIIDHFVAEYTAGRTPSPCVRCNARIKFGILLDRAREFGAERIATGHYARIREDNRGVPHLRRGADAGKDQSYFLARLSRDQLAHAVLPLGGMSKREVSGRAADLDLACRRSMESQELCFVTEGSHGNWIDVRRLDAPGKGEMVDVSGAVLGEHNGIHHYTIGQRKGLGIATGTPAYVIEIDAGLNRIVVGPRDLVLKKSAVVRDITWNDCCVPSTPVRALTQIRYNHTAASSVIVCEGRDAATIEFDEPQFAVTPGQLAVFYDGDTVLGAGWIEK